MDFTKINNTNNECAKKVVNILETIRSAISTDSNVNNKYFDLIESTIKTSKHEHILLLFEELFEYNRHITLSLLPQAVEELVSSPYLLNTNLAVWFSGYIANNIKEEEKDFVITELSSVA